MVLAWAQASSRNLASGLGHLLSTDAYRERTSAIADALEHELGLDTALDAIEQVLG